MNVFLLFSSIENEKTNEEREYTIAVKKGKAIQKAKQTTKSIDQRQKKSGNDVTSAKIFEIFEIFVPTAHLTQSRLSSFIFFPLSLGCRHPQTTETR